MEHVYYTTINPFTDTYIFAKTTYILLIWFLLFFGNYGFMMAFYNEPFILAVVRNLFTRKIIGDVCFLQAYIAVMFFAA